MNWIKLCGTLALGSFLVACGGGGSGAGTSPFGTGSGSSSGSSGSGAGTGGTTVPTLNLSISSTTASVAAPATVTATIKDANGNGVAGQVVTFGTVGSLGSFNPPSALTDASGVAAVKLTPASSNSNGADLVVAKATVGSNALSGTIGYQVSPSGSTTPITGGPTISLTLSSPAVTSTVSPTATAVVKDANGVPVSGVVVTFKTAAGGIGAFAVASGLTDATGTTTAKLNPASSNANGADLAVAQATVGSPGVVVTASVGFSVSSTGAPAVGVPSLSLSLSTSTVTTATPATVSASVRDATGAGVAGQVVKFSTVDGLGVLPVISALTDATGVASVTLSAAKAGTSGADQVVAKTTVNGTALQASQGFQLTASTVTITGFASDVPTVGAYGQSNITVTLGGTTPGTPVNVTLSSACAAKSKATVTPPTVVTTTGTASFTYLDNGCGSPTQVFDPLQVTVPGTSAVANLSLGLTSPTVNSIIFVSATPTNIFLKGSGLETSDIVFKVLDSGGQGLAGQNVVLDATTYVGGLLLNLGNTPVTLQSNSNGIVSVKINSGTVPTPVRVKATISGTSISTVSSNLSIGVGLPSQLGFSLSQTTLNIEGYDIDGIGNTYNIIASDRLGNPVPTGTAINFIAEGGSIASSSQTALVGGLARASASFLSANPRPLDGRVTIVAYAIGEESFLDQNGNNTWDAGEPFQDLGDVYLNRLFNGVYDPVNDQLIPGGASPAAACAAPGSALLALDKTIPSIGVVGGSPRCDGTWGRAYVRRAAETVFSRSTARPRWVAAPRDSSGTVSALFSTSGSACNSDGLVTGYDNVGAAQNGTFYTVGGADGLYNLASAGALSFLVSDSNLLRLNPMAAGSTVSVAVTTGMSVSVAGGTPVPSTTDATFATINYGFNAGTTSGVITLTFVSPSGLATGVPLSVSTAAPPGGAISCP
jgi:hypothetical protein